MQGFLLHKDRQPALVSQKIFIPQDFFLRGNEISFHLHLKTAVAPPVFYHLQGFAQLSVKACYHDFRPGQHIFHRLLFMYGNQKFLHILHIPRYLGKSLVQVPVLFILTIENTDKIGGIKQLHRFLPVVSRQICELKQIHQFPFRTFQHLVQYHHMKRDLIFPTIGNDEEPALPLLPFPHSPGIKTVLYILPGS